MSTAIAIVAVVISVLAFTAGGLALITLGRLRRSVGLLGRGSTHSRESFVEASARHANAADRARTELDALRADFGLLHTATMAELEAMRGQLSTLGGFRRDELDLVVSAERADVGRHHLDRVQAQVDADFAVIRAEIEQLHVAMSAETQAERTQLAADNSATRDQLRGAIDKVEKVISTALRRVALVRYDAFDDLGGRLSFSLAVLDSRGDGVTLTSLAGRNETRLYAKPISAGSSTTDLSPEEAQAVRAAAAG